MNDYEAKQEAKRQRYEELARKNREEASRRHQGVRDICDRIPFGQPILVGHHSEAHARADQKRIENGMRKSIEASEKADYYADKAASVGKGGISSDDPDAIEKLKEKLASLEANQEYMKRINKIHRAYVKNPDSLDKEELSDKEREFIINYKPTYSWEPPPFPPYSLQNNNANIKRVRDRIAHLERLSALETKELKHGDITIVQNTEENRVQVLFPGKPNEKVRKQLKRWGFRWAPSNKAWQRNLSTAAVGYAEFVVKYINEELGGEWK